MHPFFLQYLGKRCPLAVTCSKVTSTSNCQRSTPGTFTETVFCTLFSESLIKASNRFNATEWRLALRAGKQTAAKHESREIEHLLCMAISGGSRFSERCF